MTAAVRSVGELLGIDPAARRERGQGRCSASGRGRRTACSPSLRAHPLGRNAAMIGTCADERPGCVMLDTGFGRRLLAEPDGEPLPRIC